MCVLFTVVKSKEALLAQLSCFQDGSALNLTIVVDYPFAEDFSKDPFALSVMSVLSALKKQGIASFIPSCSLTLSISDVKMSYVSWNKQHN